MRTREDNFEYQVKEMVKRFVNNFGMKKSEDINDVAWENKEHFGEEALNVIWEYLGSDCIEEMVEELDKDGEVEFEEEEEE